MQSSYSIEDMELMYLVQRSDTSWGVNDCICTASCGCYSRVATIKAVAIK